MADFLPDNYTVPNESNYSKLQKGDNKFRIMGSPLLGWEDWTADKKPVRYPMNGKPEHSINPEKPIKHFWAMPVWDYQMNKVTILEITQKSIQNAVGALAKNADWGDPRNYDITITRAGDGMQTEYSVTPIPPKKLPKEITDAFGAATINLEALFDGGDPFKLPF